MIALTLDEAAALPRWVGWRQENRKGKSTKVPFMASGAGRAKADDPATWDVRPRAEAWATKHVNGTDGGVGLQLGILAERPDVALGGVDLDTCRDPASGSIAPWAAEVIYCLGTYAEVSPSGTGVKCYFIYAAGDLPALRKAMGSEHGRSFKRGSGDHPEAIELHVGNRYFAVTDQRLAEARPDIRPVSLGTMLWLIRKAGPESSPRGRPGDAEAAEAGQDDDALMARLRAAMAGDAGLAKRWNGETQGLADASRSGLAFALGAAVKRHGFGYAEMRGLLRRNPHTREWATTKGEAGGARELCRIWDKAGTDPRAAAQPQPARAPNMAVLNRSAAAAPAMPSTCSARHGRGGWSARRRGPTPPSITSPCRCSPSRLP